jgi:hypothetical protein
LINGRSIGLIHFGDSTLVRASLIYIWHVHLLSYLGKIVAAAARCAELEKVPFSRQAWLGTQWIDGQLRWTAGH